MVSFFFNTHAHTHRKYQLWGITKPLTHTHKHTQHIDDNHKIFDKNLRLLLAETHKTELSLQFMCVGFRQGYLQKGKISYFIVQNGSRRGSEERKSIHLYTAMRYFNHKRWDRQAARGA